MKKPVRVPYEVKVAMHDILYEAMLTTHASLNAAFAIMDITYDEHAFEAADETAQALRHLSRAARHIYLMPASESQ